jgi:hypothetical protein
MHPRVSSADEQNDLQAAQRLWLKFRDTNSSAERNLYAGGSSERGMQDGNVFSFFVPTFTFGMCQWLPTAANPAAVAANHKSLTHSSRVISHPQSLLPRVPTKPRANGLSNRYLRRHES